MKRTVFAAAGSLMLSAYFGLKAPGIQASRAEPQSVNARASFPHDKPEHRKLECSRCHAISGVQPDVKEFPGHKACVLCHNFAAMFFAKDPVLFCGICHNGRAVSKTQPALFSFPKAGVTTDFGIGFSHPSHGKPLPDSASIPAGFAAGRALGCIDCHRKNAVRTAAEPEMTTATGHGSCFKCHGERPVKPPSMTQCAECHKLGGPHSPGLFGKVRGFKHSEHELDTRPKRKSELRTPRAGDYLCTECHKSAVNAKSLAEIGLPTRQECTTCHTGRPGLPDPLSDEVLRLLRAAAARTAGGSGAVASADEPGDHTER